MLEIKMKEADIILNNNEVIIEGDLKINGKLILKEPMQSSPDSGGIVQGQTNLPFTYEDGTLKPRLTCGSKEVSLTNTSGHFTRIGNRIFFNASFIVSNLNGATGYVRFHTGLTHIAKSASACTVWSANIKLDPHLILNTCLIGAAASDGFIYTLDTSTGGNEGLRHTALTLSPPSNFVISGNYQI